MVWSFPLIWKMDLIVIGIDKGACCARLERLPKPTQVIVRCGRIAPFADARDLLIIAELRARLAILDRNDNLVCKLGDNGVIAEAEGWPNVSAHLISPVKFNSPHGIAVDHAGSVYVAEWLIGSRITKLLKG